jgi:aspartyl-tRNA(Asn)/glutamyl-tRNA(Gln) amidotransferase subunit A
LSYSLDSIGPMARSVADCAMADAVMAGDEPLLLEPIPLANLRVGVAQGMALDRLDDTVGKRFPAALDRLEKAGVRLSAEKLPLLDRMVEVNAKGGVLPAEALAVHRDRLARRGGDIDPNVRLRLERAQGISAADYVEMTHARNALIAAMDAQLAGFDVLAMPTSPVVAPLLAEVATPEEFTRRNAMVLRNTTMWNFFDCCAISLPLPREGGLPTGLMLVARNGGDHRLFRIAAAVERQLAL